MAGTWIRGETEGTWAMSQNQPVRYDIVRVNQCIYYSPRTASLSNVHHKVHWQFFGTVNHKRAHGCWKQRPPISPCAFARCCRHIHKLAQWRASTIKTLSCSNFKMSPDRCFAGCLFRLNAWAASFIFSLLQLHHQHQRDSLARDMLARQVFAANFCCGLGYFWRGCVRKCNIHSALLAY